MIGGSPPRRDGIVEVTGRARYPGDLVRPGMARRAVARARRPRARLGRLDPGPDPGDRGMVAVLTTAEVPGPNADGAIEAEGPVLSREVVRFVGDGVGPAAAP
jgi:xanthine dehydrogenase molybdopterin-binding subunit B